MGGVVPGFFSASLAAAERGRESETVVFFALLFLMPCWSLAFFAGGFTSYAVTSSSDEESEAASSALGAGDGSATGSSQLISFGIVDRRIKEETSRVDLCG